jgi:hypothetical protein
MTMLTAAALAAAPSPRARAGLIQAAIDGAGGAPVVVPPGTWTVTTIRLISGTTLHLARGAVLRCHDVLADYPQPERHSDAGNKDRQPWHLIGAYDATDIAITGEGVIDGNGFAFWERPMIENFKAGIDVDRYCDEHGLPPVYRNKFHPWYREKKTRISPLLEIDRCRGVRLDGFTIRDSPGWTVHLNTSDDIRIRGVTVRNSLFGPNTDGFDINGCRDVIVADCDLTCGDDAIIIKSMADSRSCERIAVTNCIVASNCAALGLGAECAHAIRDVTFSNCVIRQALRAIQIEMWESGLIENVTFTNITGTTNCPIPLQRAIYLDIQHHGRTDGQLGRMRNVLISNVALTTRGRIVATAADGACIDGLVLRDIHLTYPAIEDASVTVPQYRSGQMSNDCPESRAVNAVLVADNVRRLVVDNIQATWPNDPGNPADATADTETNPHHTNPPMHALFLRNCTGVVDVPLLTAHRGAERTVVRGGAVQLRA